jgi:hypothetical protein
MMDRLLRRRVMVRVFMITVMIKGKFEESALLRLSCTFRGVDRRKSATHV